MNNPTISILRAATRKSGTPLNILTAPTHERYESGLALTGHNFYGIQGQHIKDWKEIYAPRPHNYHILDGENLPIEVEFDLVLSQNKFGQFQKLERLAKLLHLPLISMEHTLPHPQWGPEYIAHTLQMRGQLNIFITDYSIEKWQWNDLGDTIVIPHMVDSDVFTPDGNSRKNHILTVANDYIGRDWCLNFSSYKRVCIDKGLPVRPVGDTPGLSKAAKDTKELVHEYQTSSIFLNTAHVSPIPTSLLEAMSCGCAVVSCNTCAIPEYISHGVNGFLYNTDSEMYRCLELLLEKPDLAIQFGQKARETILRKCNKTDFINRWNTAFEFVIEKGYL